MKKLNVRLLLIVLVFMTSYGYAQDVTNPKTQTDSISIPAKSSAEPTIHVGNIENSDGRISKEEILKNSFLTAKALNNAVDWEILSFTVTFVRNGVEDAPIMVRGNQFPEQIKSRIQSASSGTILEISDIRIQSSIAGRRSIARTIVIRIQ